MRRTRGILWPLELTAVGSTPLALWVVTEAPAQHREGSGSILLVERYAKSELVAMVSNVNRDNGKQSRTSKVDKNNEL